MGPAGLRRSSRLLGESALAVLAPAFVDVESMFLLSTVGNTKMVQRQRWRSELEGASGRDSHVEMTKGSLQGEVKAGSKADILNRPPPAVTIPPAALATSSATIASQSSIELYSLAVIAERQGQLNDALRNYRAAFRKDPDVDKHYHQAQLAQGAHETDNHGLNNNSVDDLVFSYERTLQLEPDYERQKQLKTRSSTAEYARQLLEKFKDNPYDPDKKEPITVPGLSSAVSPMSDEPLSPDICFHPKNVNRPVHIARLPGELLLHILSFLCAPSLHAKCPDVRSLERGFSLTSRKARLFTLSSPALYRCLCESVFHPPVQIEPSSISATALNSKVYASDWRLMWIEHPRIRTDGVYISQITYLRKGAQDGSSYYDPTHCVTYYRYLCFLPGGDVVSLLSHDIPAQIVPTLLSSSHSARPQAGYTVGRWRLRQSESSSSGETGVGGAVVHLSSLEDPRIEHPGDVKYSFKMSCKLKSTTRGRMNKLEMLSLLALNHRTGEEAPIPIKQPNGAMPSFYFSRVLSYD